MKIVQKMHAFVPALAVAAALAAFTTVASAQTANRQIALTAVPPRLGDDYSLVVKPGQTVQAVIEVRNPSDVYTNVETFARDFYVAADGETPMPVEGDDMDTKWALSQWLTLTPTVSTIEPRGSSTIVVTIAVPDNALPGGRYAMILHRPVSATGAMTTTGAQINAQVGTLLYVVVDGEVTEDADVETFAFKGFNEMGPVPYEVDIHNASSLHVRPESTITIKNMFGKVVDEIALDTKNIFPDSTRSFTGLWNKTWGFGPYTAQLVGTYGTQGNMISATTTFWILPVRLILAILLIGVLVAVVMVSTRTKYTKMIEAEEAKVRKLDEKLKKARRK